VEHLVPTKPDSLEMKRAKQMIDLSDPLRHARVVRIFGFEQEFEACAREAAIEAPNPTIGA
jgi:hypothetical protein